MAGRRESFLQLIDLVYAIYDELHGRNLKNADHANVKAHEALSELCVSLQREEVGEALFGRVGPRGYLHYLNGEFCKII